VALAAAASAVLALAATANAAPQTFTPATGPDLQAAITSANANPGADTILLQPVIYSPTAPMTITDDVTISGDHSFQAATQGPAMDGTSVVPLQADMLTVSANVTARFQGFTVSSGSTSPFAAFKINGTAFFDGMVLSGNGGTQLSVGNSGTANVTNTSVDNGLSLGILNNGTTTLLNSSVDFNTGGGIETTGTLRLNNSLVTNNTAIATAHDCFHPATSSITSMDSDSTCGVAMHGDPVYNFADFRGGPTPSAEPTDASAINVGDNSICPTADQRFFVRPVGQCDLGAVEVNAVEDTTPPACVVTATRVGLPRQQDVTLSDGESGLGNDGVRPQDVTITNGTVAFTPFATPFRSPASSPPPSNGGLVLTATKTTADTPTQWSFVARDWGGNTKTCR
jgi:hypothetical protein